MLAFSFEAQTQRVKDVCLHFILPFIFSFTLSLFSLLLRSLLYGNLLTYAAEKHLHNFCYAAKKAVKPISG